MQNEICPITLDPLAGKPPEEVFVHADVGFDMLALYEYLVQAPKFTNPMNRIPFTIEDLERLEQQMEMVFGKDCILHKEDEEDQEIHLPSPSASTEESGQFHDEDDGFDVDHAQRSIDWLDDAELISRLNTSILNVSTESNARLIRLRVDIDMDGADVPPLLLSPSSASSSSSAPPSFAESHVPREEEDDAMLDETKEEEGEDEEEDEFLHITSDALPPRRTFPSVADMYRDTGRQRRISDRLSLLQYLEYDAMGLLVQLMDMVYDNHFHRFVWQHTSLDVIDTVTTYLTQENSAENSENPSEVFTHITEPSPNPTSPADYNLEVVYTECWEVYRLVILQNLERRYAETARDILNISRNDFAALFACHRAHVRQRASEQEVNYDAVLEILDAVERELFPLEQT